MGQAHLVRDLDHDLTQAEVQTDQQIGEKQNEIIRNRRKGGIAAVRTAEEDQEV